MPYPAGIKVAGNPSPIRIQTETEYAYPEPALYRERYRGERTSMEAAINGFTFSKYKSLRYRQDGASAEVEITSRTIIDVTDVVEIEFNAVQREWWTAPPYAVLSNVDRLKIVGKLREDDIFAQSGNTPDEIATNHAALKAQLGTLGGAFEDVFLNGESYAAILPVVTFTRTVDRYYGNPFIIADMGKVFLTQSMINSLPANSQFVISQITNTVGANSLQTLGWLKSGRYSVSSNGDSNYIQTYTFDAWRTSGYSFL